MWRWMKAPNDRSRGCTSSTPQCRQGRADCKEDEIFHFIEKYAYKFDEVEKELNRIYGTEEKYKDLEDFNWNIVGEKKPKEKKQQPQRRQNERR